MQRKLIDSLKIISKKNDSDGIVADYLLNNLDNLEEITISQIQKELFVSISIPTRLAKKLNLHGFKELKYALIQEVENQNNNFETSYTKYVDNIITRMKYSKEVINDYQIERIINKLYHCSKVVIFAKAEYQLISEDFALKLRRLGKTVLNDKDDDIQYINYKNIDGDSVVIFISYSGKVSLFQKISSKLKNHECLTIAFTRQNNNLIMANEYIALSPAESEYSVQRNLSRMEIIVVLNYIFESFMQKYQEEYSDLLEETKFN